MMTDNQQRAHELAQRVGVYDTDEIRVALDEAEARGRAEGYRAAVEKSRQFCARSGGCIS